MPHLPHCKVEGLFMPHIRITQEDLFIPHITFKQYVITLYRGGSIHASYGFPLCVALILRPILTILRSILTS